MNLGPDRRCALLTAVDFLLSLLPFPPAEPIPTDRFTMGNANISAVLQITNFYKDNTWFCSAAQTVP
jgi:hypothetical protein